MEKSNYPWLNNFVSIEIVDDKIGVTQCRDGELMESELVGMDIRGYDLIQNSIEDADLIVAFQADTLRMLLKRILEPNISWYSQTKYLSVSSLVKSIAGDLNFGSACLHFKVPTGASQENGRGWSAGDKSKMSAELILKLGSKHYVERYVVSPM